MTLMYDSVSGNAIPLTAQIVAGYIDGSYGPNDPYGSGWSAAAWARYPNAQHVTITVAGTPGARAADCERGAMTPPQTANWAKNEVNAGRRPTVYADASDWSNGVDAALAAVGLQRVRDVDGWVAHITAPAPAAPPAGFVAIQYAQNVAGENGGRVDISVTDGVWPSARPNPVPHPNPGGVVGKPDLKLSPQSQLPVIANQGPSNSLDLYWQTPDAQWHGPYGVGGVNTTYSDPTLGFDHSGLIIVTAEGPGNVPYFYWQTADAQFHGPLGL